MPVCDVQTTLIKKDKKKLKMIGEMNRLKEHPVFTEA